MIRLRPYKACDATEIVKWIKDEYGFRQWCADRFESYPINAELMNTYYKTFDNDTSFWQMTALDEKDVIGHLIMRFTDKEEKILRLGFIIIDDKKRGKGYGKEMIKLALHYAFDIVKVEKVTLGVFENNKGAYYTYKSIGFEELSSHEMKHYSIMGEDWACIEMEMKRGKIQ